MGLSSKAFLLVTIVKGKIKVKKYQFHSKANVSNLWVIQEIWQRDVVYPNHEEQRYQSKSLQLAQETWWNVKMKFHVQFSSFPDTL